MEYISLSQAFKQAKKAAAKNLPLRKASLIVNSIAILFCIALFVRAALSFSPSLHGNPWGFVFFFLDLYSTSTTCISMTMVLALCIFLYMACTTILFQSLALQVRPRFSTALNAVRRTVLPILGGHMLLGLAIGLFVAIINKLFFGCGTLLSFPLNMAKSTLFGFFSYFIIDKGHSLFQSLKDNSTAATTHIGGTVRLLVYAAIRVTLQAFYALFLLLGSLASAFTITDIYRAFMHESFAQALYQVSIPLVATILCLLILHLYARFVRPMLFATEVQLYRQMDTILESKRD